ncbi:uncharacterized protein [Mycetomoellerius zeteki]|uniref:uncharacterized protein n=1 Tax=Mycetomoellerius zeteki TaxID=64791 RepID=UPI00084E93B4|nr:PREDICTED: uncharacterized protein LOC108720982 [Trachymyrmex zeteki]
MDNKIGSVIISIILNNDEEIENISNSSDESDSDNENEELCLNEELEILYFILMLDTTRGEMIISEKLSDYVERVIPGYSKTVFKEHFRMFPQTFEMVLIIIGPGLRAINNNLCNRKPISEEKQLLIAIWFMATPDSYRSIATKFGVGRATAFRALRIQTLEHILEELLKLKHFRTHV